MSRIVTVGVAQLGPIHRTESRCAVVDRLLALLRQGKQRHCQLVVFPEAALTAFFPHWYMEDPAEIDTFFECEMPGPDTRPLFAEARQAGIAFYLGYCELDTSGGRPRHFNTSILVDETGQLVGKYRKIHLPGHATFQPGQTYQNLEKHYFEVGDLGFPVWRCCGGILGMCICNDRRWPEAYRVMGLQGVEMVLLGYNTPLESVHGPVEPRHLPMFHHWLSMQAGAYQNATWVVAAAKAGLEEGVYQIGGSCIIAPTGEMVVHALSDADELIVADCDLDLGTRLKETVFNFAAHRRPEHYRLIVDRTGAIPPAK